MQIFDDIGKLEILKVLDTAGIGYKKDSGQPHTYSILKDDGKVDNSFKVHTVKNIVKDFGKTGITGNPFDFIGRYLLDQDTQTNTGKAATVKWFIEKGLVTAPEQTKTFVKSLSGEDLFNDFDSYKLNGYKQDISAMLLSRGVDYTFIQKNTELLGEIFKDIGYYDNYFTTEFETYKDDNGQWVNKEGDDPKTVAVFMYPCYNDKKEIIGMKLRRKDGKTIRGKKSYAVGKTGLLFNKVNSTRAYIVEGEMDYLIMRIMGFDSVVGNLGGVQSGRVMLKDLLFDTNEIVCMYDNDIAGQGGKLSLQETFNRTISDIEFPIREDKNGVTLTDVNDLYKAGYDTKEKWLKIFESMKNIGDNDTKKKDPRFVQLDSTLEYYDTKYNRIQKTDNVAGFLGMTKKELFQAVSGGVIPSYEGLCYREGGRVGFYNTLDETTIVKHGGDAKPELHPEIEYLISNVCNKKMKNVHWLHKAILYKLTHINDVHVPALVLYGTGGSGKGTFLNLLSKIFGEVNTQIGLGQKDLEGSFDSYQGGKLIVEFKEVSSGNKHNDKKILDRIKSFVGESKISVNAKHQNVREADNIAWFHLSSNHPVPIQLDSKHSGNRRFSIIKTGPALDKLRAEHMNHTLFKDKEIIKSYINWLYDNYGQVLEYKNMPPLENEEKENLVEACEGAAVVFFEWLENKYPHIRKITVKQKNWLLQNYCSETGEDQFDIKYKQNNFDLSLSHRYEKKRVRLGDVVQKGYFINKTDFELKHMPEGRNSYFEDKEVTSMDGITF